MRVVGSRLAGEHERFGVEYGGGVCQRKTAFGKDGRRHVVGLDTACRIRIVYQGGGTLRTRGQRVDNDTFTTGGNEAGGQVQSHGGVEGAGVFAVIVIVELKRSWSIRRDQGVGAEDGMKTE